MTTSTATRPDGPWFIADERALDFINTLAMAEHSPHDFLQSDEDVLLWLNHAGFAAAAVGEPGELLAAARALRTTIRELVTAKKKGRDAGAERAQYLAGAGAELFADKR